MAEPSNLVILILVIFDKNPTLLERAERRGMLQNGIKGRSQEVVKTQIMSGYYTKRRCEEIRCRNKRRKNKEKMYTMMRNELLDQRSTLRKTYTRLHLTHARHYL